MSVYVRVDAGAALLMQRSMAAQDIDRTGSGFDQRRDLRPGRNARRRSDECTSPLVRVWIVVSLVHMYAICLAYFEVNRYIRIINTEMRTWQKIIATAAALK